MRRGEICQRTEEVPSEISNRRANNFSGQRGHFPNPPDATNPDPATLREQWRFAIRQYSRWYSQAWGSAILAGVSFFALGWIIKGSNPLPSFRDESPSPPSSLIRWMKLADEMTMATMNDDAFPFRVGSAGITSYNCLVLLETDSMPPQVHYFSQQNSQLFDLSTLVLHNPIVKIMFLDMGSTLIMKVINKLA
ncbi:Casein kinase substrate, phosphoprotein PP28 [Quillaja saponaria]|uniref:Casein kinase substrate, phosphoprotein PP28 n=1 Tax=Quillaja saponaria TaxID=32244 RepID=A0AAD7PV78_QUISA|nr:Casein kinase substrate, phosphoprotein PP28 [Quillaja saponaria]